MDSRHWDDMILLLLDSYIGSKSKEITQNLIESLKKNKGNIQLKKLIN